MSTNLLVPGQCGEDQCIPCNVECPIEWYEYDCRLYWRIINPLDWSAPYTVTIVGPSSTEYYDSIPSGIIDEPVTGTYSAMIEKDAVESDACEIEYEECEPVYLCCVRFESVNVRVSANIPAIEFYAAGGSTRQFRTLGAIASEEAFSVTGAMSSGTKTDDICYDTWEPTSTTDEDTGVEVTYLVYSGIPYTMGDPVCVAPGTDYYLQTITVRFHVRHADLNVSVVGKCTAYSLSTVGLPLGATPTAVSVGDIVLNGGVGLGFLDPCGEYPAIGSLQIIGDLCSGDPSDLEIVFELWPDVIPL
jgi:hypothetical protein